MDNVLQAPLILITGGGRGVGAATAPEVFRRRRSRHHLRYVAGPRNPFLRLGVRGSSTLEGGSPDADGFARMSGHLLPPRGSGDYD
jgi:NAD(P)-dependent dehydrogenase (short-subunit alcohol dehydrogenase family)